MSETKIDCFSVGSNEARQVEFTILAINGLVSVHMFSRPDGSRVMLSLTPFDAEKLGKTLQEFAQVAESEVVDLSKVQPSKKRA
jgi:hypothetical protein